jgi:hypothetical protein
MGEVLFSVGAGQYWAGCKRRSAQLNPIAQRSRNGSSTRNPDFRSTRCGSGTWKNRPDANAAIPALKILLGDTDAYKRREAAIAIWRINSDVTNTLPLLVEGIIQDDESTRWELIEAMAEMGSSAKDAVPALVQQLQQKPGENLRNEWNRSRISNALLKIDPEAAAKAGMK